MAAYDELDVDGVIGYNILRGTGIVLDYEARSFRLGPVENPDLPDELQLLLYRRSHEPLVG